MPRKRKTKYYHAALHPADRLNLRRLADAWSLSLADTIHVLLATSLKAKGIDVLGVITPPSIPSE